MLDNWVFILLISLWIIALLTNIKWRRTIKIFFINLGIAIGYTSIILFFFGEGRESIGNVIFNALVLIFHAIVLIIYSIKSSFVKSKSNINIEEKN
ncbi:MAG TPA: hypothetical protein PK833_10795 [Vicingus sp.]|nr:hypothetical protein [Candidatus Woesebacteria bacterium]HRP60750.1 hypothetical protein [Vicingus sp.]